MTDRQADFMSSFNQLKGNEELIVYIEPGTASEDDIANLLTEISKLYRMLGGSGIEFTPKGVKSPKLVH